MNETGYERAPKPKTNDILEYTDNWEHLLSHVYAFDDTKALVQRLIQRAKVRYEEDPTWLDKIKKVEIDLNNEDEEEEIKAILLKALGEGSEEDDIDEVSAEEPDDDAMAA